MTLCGLDSETYLWVPGNPAPTPVVGAIADATNVTLMLRREYLARLRALLDSVDHLVGVNIAYDLVCAAAADPSLLPLIFKAGNEGRLHCCAVREALNDIAIGQMTEKTETIQRYSEALLMERHFNTDVRNEKSGDVWRFKYGQLDGVPLDQWEQGALDYAASGARRAYNICVKQKGSQFKNLHDEPRQVRAAIALQLARAWGFRTDRAYVENLEREVEGLWNAAREELGKVGIFRPNGSQDKKRTQELVSKAFNGDPPRAPKGGIATDRDTLEESGDPYLVRLGTLGKNDKRHSQYVPALKEGLEVPINPEYNVLVVTGRISSDWQQMPQFGGIREGVIARPGTVQDSIDLVGLELRTMSQRCIDDPDIGSSLMAEFLNSGRDFHSYVGGTFINATYEEMKARVNAKDAVAKNFRDLAKVFNFGGGGGMTEGSLVYNARKGSKGEKTTAPDGTVYVGTRFCILAGKAAHCGQRMEVRKVQGVKRRLCSVCLAVTKELRAKWLIAVPEQAKLFEKAQWLTKRNKHAPCEVFGSRRVRGACTYTQWLNTAFQGAAGDGVKDAMWAIAEESYTNRRSPLWGSRVNLQVHDELWLEHPWDRRHDAAFRAAEILVERMNRVTPDCKNECKPAIMRRVFKAATDVYDRNGVLRPWWPPDAKQHWDWAPDQQQMRIDLAA